jgi:hypothetical protein
MKMNYSLVFSSLLGAFTSMPAAYAQGFNVSALGTEKNVSTIECWNLAAPPFVAAGAANYPIGNFTNSFVGILPPQTIIGQAWARQVSGIVWNWYGVISWS